MKKIISLIMITVLSSGFLTGGDFNIVKAETTNEEVIEYTELKLEEETSFVMDDVEKVVGFNCPEISAGTEKEISITAGYDNEYCKFIPEKSGWYKYYSSSKNSVRGFVYNGDVTDVIAKSDNYRQGFLGMMELYGDFEIICYFEAGESYYLGSGLARNYTGTYNVGIFEVPLATAMTVTKQEERNENIGESRTFELFFTPEDCGLENVTWASSNPEVVEIDESGECYFKSLGTAIITATTDRGLTDSLVVNVVNPTEIRINEEIKSWAGLSNEETYTFIPEVGGTYEYSVITESGMMQQATVILTIYDKNYNEVANSGDWNNYATVSCKMVAGECYYLHFDSYAYDVLGEAISKVTRIGLPSYDDVAIDSTDELMQVGEEMTLEDVKEIQPDEEKEIDIAFYGARSVHKFTPEEDGEYKFMATGNDYILFSILDENFKYISSGKNPYSKILEAGKTYIITSYISGGAPTGFGEYTIEIEKLPKVEKIELNKDEAIVGNIGHRERLSVIYTPEGCEFVDVDWSSSNSSVASVVEGTVYLKKLGKATITVYSDNGLSDSIEVKVVHPLYEIGDVTMDGNVNAEDALLALEAVAKIAELTEEEAMLGNVNGDKVVNAQDSLEILKIAANIAE